MRRIRIIEHISLDGVIQAPGGRDEDGDYAHARFGYRIFVCQSGYEQHSRDEKPLPIAGANHRPVLKS